MMAVPAFIPITIPLITPTDALGLAVLQVTPPGVALLRLVVKPWQTVSVPVIGAGSAFTTMVCVTAHPVDNV